MKSQVTLPEGYGEILSVDLQKDKRLAIAVNGAALVIAALMVAAGLLLRPTGFDFGEEDLTFLAVSALIAGVGSILYIILHEAVHGIFMRLFCELKPRFGFTGLYAYAGSDAYYAKTPYIIIALAPVVIWGAVLLLLNILFPTYFWAIYFIQITNISGAAGDFYVTLKFTRLPSDILVRDTGVSMTVYGRCETPSEAPAESEE